MSITAYNIVREFEARVADFCGSDYAVATDCCTNAIFLSLLIDRIATQRITIPAHTYISVAQAIHHAGHIPFLKDIEWTGMYRLGATSVIDSALRFRNGMYLNVGVDKSDLICLSFHIKKHIPIGRGGMILCNDYETYKKLRILAYDGREGKSYDKELIRTWGFHMYMTPEQAARGMLLLETMSVACPDDIPVSYPDLRKQPLFLVGKNYD